MAKLTELVRADTSVRKKINKTCPGCQKSYTIAMPVEGLRRYQQGELIQNAFPELSAEYREMFMTGICGACWKKMGEEE